MKHYIYGLYKKNIEYKTNSISEHLFYIGITTSKNVYFRKKNHRTEVSNIHKINIINKYDFILKILWETSTRKEAEDREEFLIRWFGDILTNICTSSKDISRAKLKPRKPKNLWKKHSKDAKIANRNRNLTVPYEKVMILIDEWAKNPLETQESFAKRHSVSRSKFKDWLRLYKPEYIGLTKKTHITIFDSIDKTNKKVRDIIQEFSNKSGLTFEKSKGIYYKLLKKRNKDKDE